jgi:hypothetical protein
LLVDRDQVEDENAQQSPAGAGQVLETVTPGLQQHLSGRDAVTGHSVGYELIKWISRPIGTGRDETVVPLTSRVRPRRPSL